MNKLKNRSCELLSFNKDKCPRNKSKKYARILNRKTKKQKPLSEKIACICDGTTMHNILTKESRSLVLWLRE